MPSSLESLVSERLTQNNIQQVAVIDDALGPPQRDDLTQFLDSFFAEVEEDDTARAELNKLADREIQAPRDIDQEVFLKLVEQQESLASLKAHYAKHIAPVIKERQAGLRNLCGCLKDEFGLDVQEHAALHDFSGTSFQIVFVDYYMGAKGDPNAVRPAKDIISKIREAYVGRPLPFVVLMSSVKVKEEDVEAFRRATDWVAGAFLFVHKDEFRDRSCLQVRLAAVAGTFLSGQRIQAFVETLSTAMESASKQFISEIRGLGTHDYAYIQMLALQADGQPLGDYMFSLLGPYFAHLLGTNADTKRERKELDKLTIQDIPPTQWPPSTALADIYASTLYEDASEDLLPPRALEGEGMLPWLHLGDLFTADGSDKVYMIVNAQCDLVFTPDSPHRPPDPNNLVLLLPGKIHPRSEALEDDRPLGFVTDFFEHDSKTYRIVWDPKHVEGKRLKVLRCWLSTKGYKRVKRLRLSAALQVQQAFASHLTRVGLPVCPPLRRPARLQMCCCGSEGKTSVLIESEDAAFVFHTRAGEYCILREDFLISIPEHFAKVVTGLASTISFLSSRSGTEEQVKKLENRKKEAAELESSYFDKLVGLMGPHLLPEPQKTKRIGDTSFCIGNDFPAQGQYKAEAIVLLNCAASPPDGGETTPDSTGSG